jgi:hypothetical protein
LTWLLAVWDVAMPGRIKLGKGVKVRTSIAEIWECVGTEFFCEINLGTLQIDTSKDLTIGFASTEELGQVVQVGVHFMSHSSILGDVTTRHVV